MPCSVRADYGFMALCLTCPMWTCLDVPMPAPATPRPFIVANDAGYLVRFASHEDARAEVDRLFALYGNATWTRHECATHVDGFDHYSYERS
jgi:hypothetical protein